MNRLGQSDPVARIVSSLNFLANNVGSLRLGVTIRMKSLARYSAGEAIVIENYATESGIPLLTRYMIDRSILSNKWCR